MIEKLRNKLVQISSFSIIAIMLLTIISAYFAIGHMTYKSSKKWLQTYMDSELHEATEIFERTKKGGIIRPEIRTLTAHKNAFNNVVYWMTPDKKLLMAEELDAPIAPIIRQTALNWDLDLHKIRSFYFELPHHSKWHFLMVAQDVYGKDGTLLGRVVVGTNLSPLNVIANRFIAVAAGIAVFVSILAFFLSRYFAARAIAPIKNVLEKQKEFISDSSHELRTPLSVLLTSVDLLEGTKDDKKIIHNMKLEILGMRDLVNNLLLLARNDSYQEKLFLSEFDVAQLIGDIVGSMQVVAAQKKMEIAVQVVTGLHLKADEAKIRQLLIILLDNAIKYSPEGTKITLSAVEKNGAVHLAVQDEGEGIAEENLAKIFDRFYRVDKARSRAMGGFGLGLPMAKQIVEAHHGKIIVKSAPTKGTTFEVILP